MPYFFSFFFEVFFAFFLSKEVRESRRQQEQRIVEVDSGVRQDYDFKLAQALQVSNHCFPFRQKQKESNVVLSSMNPSRDATCCEGTKPGDCLCLCDV